jgi:hypothetical protein
MENYMSLPRWASLDTIVLLNNHINYFTKIVYWWLCTLVEVNKKLRIDVKDLAKKMDTKPNAIISALNALSKYGYITQRAISKYVAEISFDRMEDSLPLKMEKQKRNGYDENEKEFLLAKFLFECILENKPTFKKPNLQEWALHIDRLIHIDRRDPSRIMDIIEKCRDDDFWNKNILSTRKLRIQFDQLELKFGFVKKRRMKLKSLDEELTINIARWFSKLTKMATPITVEDKDYQYIINAANILVKMRGSYKIKPEQLLKLYKRFWREKQEDENFGALYPKTICSESMTRIEFPQFLKRSMPGIDFRRKKT